MKNALVKFEMTLNLPEKELLRILGDKLGAEEDEETIYNKIENAVAEDPTAYLEYVQYEEVTDVTF